MNNKRKCTNEKYLAREAENFTKYLINRYPERAVVDLYTRIIKSRGMEAKNGKDIILLEYALNHPWIIGVADSYLALFNPESEFRYRIYVMFAILESTPSYFKDFLPNKHSPFYILYIAYSGIKDLLEIPFGMIVVLLLRSK